MVSVKVGVAEFIAADGGLKFVASTEFYSPRWQNRCCVHDVQVRERDGARAAAIKEHKARCLKGGK